MKARAFGKSVSAGWMDRAHALLRRYVDAQGRVDYGRLAGDRDLMAVLNAVARQDPRGFRTDADALAFYLNAYNLAALAIVARLARRNPRFLAQGLRSLWTRIRFFYMERVGIASRPRSLFGLEFFVIRGRFRDPRIHFALVCATSSCPPLKDGIYAPDRLQEDLEAAARNFMRPGVGYTIAAASVTITFNRIFKWYRKDFREIGGPRRRP